MSPREGWRGLVALATAWLICGCGRAPIEIQLPPESLHPTDPGAREQIASREAEIRRLVGDRAGAAKLADAVGELGRLYHGYFAVDSNSLPQLQAAADCYREANRLDDQDWRWPYLLGYAQVHRRELDDALRHFEAALELNDRHPPLWHRIGAAQSELGHLEEAEASWARALELDPDLAAAHYGLGHLAMGRGESEVAVRHLERAVELQPDAARGRHTLGLAYRDLGEVDRAAEHLALGGATEYTLGDVLTEEIGLLPTGSQALVRLGLMAVLGGDLEAAIRLLEQAVEKDSASAFASRNLAVALEDAGRPDEALVAYRRVVELEPDDAIAHHSLGRLELAAGAVDLALTHLRRAVELAPDYKQARHTLAAALQRSGRSAEAVAEYEEALRLDPDDALAQRALAMALRSADRPAQAIDAFERALRQRLEPMEEAVLRLELGRTLAITDRPREAAAQLERAHDLAPELGEAVLLLGLVYMRTGQLERAGTAFETVLRERPAFGPARVGLAQALQQRGRCDEASRVLAEGVRLAPSDATLESALRQLRAAC